MRKNPKKAQKNTQPQVQFDQHEISLLDQVYLDDPKCLSRCRFDFTCHDAPQLCLAYSNKIRGFPSV